MNPTLLSSAALPAMPQWRRWLRQPVGRGHWRRWRRILTVVYVLTAIAGLHDYITLLSAPTLIGGLALLYTPTFEKHPPERFRFAWPAFFFIALFFAIPVRTSLYLALCCSFCLLLETFYRRVTATLPFILGLLPPVTAYFVDNFSFPIRLQLTALAGRLIALAGLPVTVAGNAITVRQHAFSVDPACIGLHLLLSSLLAALLLINYYQSHYRRRLRPLAVGLLLTTAVGLNILANLLRIMVLVVLAIPPGNPLHDALGLIFLLGYILLPLLPLIRWTVRRHGIAREESARRPARSRYGLVVNSILAIAVLMLVVLLFRSEKARPPGLLAGDRIPGYTLKEREDGVLQLDNGWSLVYIKPIPGFYYTDHTPTLCWLGSGYSFTEIADTLVVGTKIFTAVMQSPNKQCLYTAWWYDNGLRRSIQPFDWRWDLIHGAPPYAVVNVTASTPQQLQTELISILKTQRFHPLLGRAVAPARVKIW
jgi:exosortase N